MRRPQRVHVSRSDRKAIKLAVACCYLGGIFCKEVSGTHYPEHQPQKQYTKQTGQVYSSMGAEEYFDFLGEALSFFKSNQQFRSRKRHAWLLHDRETAHNNRYVEHRLEQLGLRHELLPARSPDLQPLDYGIFGGCKRVLGSKRLELSDWSSQVATFKQLLKTAPFKKAIEQFPLRLRACIQARGQHFETRLSALQRMLVPGRDLISWEGFAETAVAGD